MQIGLRAFTDSCCIKRFRRRFARFLYFQGEIFIPFTQCDHNDLPFWQRYELDEMMALFWTNINLPALYVLNSVGLIGSILLFRSQFQRDNAVWQEEMQNVYANLAPEAESSPEIPS